MHLSPSRPAPTTQDVNEAVVQAEAAARNAGAPEEVTLRTKLCCLAALLSIFTLIAGVSSTGGYATVIATDLGSPNDAAWFSNVAQVCLAILAPAIATSSDYVGRKPAMCTTLFLGGLGAVVAASAKNIKVGLLGAVLTGCGFCTQPLAVAIPSELLPRSKRSLMQAAVNVASNLGGLLGILIGAFFVKQNGPGWRWIYWMLAILYWSTLLVVLACYRPGRRVPSSVHDALSPFRRAVFGVDVAGGLLLACGVTPLFVGLVLAKAPYSWADVHVLAPICIGLAFIAAFAVYEWRFCVDGILHHQLFKKSRNYSLCMVLIFVDGLLFFTFNTFWARQAQLVFGMSISQAGLRFVTFWAMSFVGAPAVGVLAHLFKEVKYLLMVGYTIYAVAAIGLATITPDHLAAAQVFAALGGLAFSFPLTLVASCAQLSAPPALMATASNNMLVTRAIGGVVGVAAGNAVWKTRFAALAAIAGEAMDQREQYADSFRYIWCVIAPFAALAVVTCFFLEPIKSMLTSEVDAPAEDHPREKTVA